MVKAKYHNFYQFIHHPGYQYILGVVILISVYLSCLPVMNAQNTAPEIKQHIYNQLNISNQNWNISQNAANGLIYFANSRGLIEYNGITSKLYELPYDKSVRSVCVDDSGTIFTGSFEEFGYWKLQSDGSLSYHSLSSLTNIQKNDDIWKLYVNNDKVFFQSFTTIYVYDYRKVVSVKTPFNMLFMLRADNRFIVQGIDQGLYWFDGLNFEFIRGSEQFGTMKVHSIIEKDSGEILICTASKGIYLFDKQTFQKWNSQASGFLKTYMCNAGLSVNDSLLVLGSILNGIIICDQEGNIQNHFNLSNGLQNNTVLALYSGNQSDLWAGLDDGANYINILSPTTYYANTSGTLGTIYSIYKDNDKLLLGTNHGLFKATIASVKDNFNFSDIQIIAGSQGQVWTIQNFHEQLLCGHNDGTFIYKNDRLIKISDITGGWSFTMPENDLLIQGTYTGLIVFDEDTNGIWKFRNRITGYSEPTRHVEVDYLGYIWASHAMKGVYKLVLNENLDSVIQSHYYASISDKPHIIDVYELNNRMLFTTSENIYTYDYVNDSMVPFNPLIEDLGEYSHSTQIIPHAKNLYWFISRNKSALFDVAIGFNADKKMEIIFDNPYLPERDIQILQLNDHVLLIPNQQGFTAFNSALSAQTKDTTKLFVQKMVLSGRKKTHSFGIQPDKKVIVPYYLNNLTAYFANPSHFGQQSKTFYYLLPEIEDTWHTTTLDHFSYLNLKPGKYNLKLRSVLGEDAVLVPFTINNPWYSTWIAFLIYSCIMVLMIIVILKIFRFELTKQKQLLEYEVTKDKLENELSYKTQELMFTMRYLIQKNEILTELKGEIDSMKEDASRYPVKFVKNMESTIRKGLELHTEEWRNALNNLKLSEQGFFRKLLDNYPNLTPHDLRMCSYLRMNFSTKEIAKLLNVSTRGVEISRYRLRKKLNLGHDVNLTGFLMSIQFEEDVT